MKSTSVKINPENLERLKKMSEHSGRTIQHFVNEAVKQKLDQVESIVPEAINNPETSTADYKVG